MSAVSPSSLTLHSPEGTKTIALNASTTYYQGETAATLAAVKVGEIVHVRLVDPTAAHPVAAVVRVVPAHLAGFVTAIDGPKITLIDGSGFTRTLTTSSATTYDKDGATGSASDIKVGGFIHAAGTVDPDGTTLDATKVVTGRPHPFGPGQGHGPEQGPEQGPGPDGGPGA